MGHNGTKTGRTIAPQSITVWRNDVTVNYEIDNQNNGGGERSEIYALSDKSLKRMCFVAHNTAVTFDTMITLTYPGEFTKNGIAVKHHRKRMIQWLGRKCEIDSYFWFLEFQRRGAPHFHIFTSGGCPNKMRPDISLKWYGIVDSGDDRHLRAGTRTERLRRPDAAGRYAAKYASKPHQKIVPKDYRNVGRFWGHSKDVKPEPIAQQEISSWWQLFTALDGWNYQQKLVEKGVMSTLYNAADIALENIHAEETR